MSIESSKEGCMVEDHELYYPDVFFHGWTEDGKEYEIPNKVDIARVNESRCQDREVNLQETRRTLYEESCDIGRACTEHMEYLPAKPELLDEHGKIQDYKAGCSRCKTSGDSGIPDRDHILFVPRSVLPRRVSPL
jgi:hypothetical protein